MKTFTKALVFLAPMFAFASTALAEGPSAADYAIPPVWWLAPVSAVAALVVACIFYKKMMGAPEGSDKMIEIARHVREGAYAYLFRQYRVVTFVFMLLFIIFAGLA